jgi:CheY-like chemotaxis protein
MTEPASTVHPSTGDGGKGCSHESPTVLLVEDNWGDIRLLAESFEETDVTVYTVTDGREALDFLREDGDFEATPRLEINLLDLNLPRTSGTAVLEELDEASGVLSTIPVIVLTSSQDQQDILRAYESNANAYLRKPVDPTAYMETLRTCRAFWFETAELPETGSERTGVE